MWKELSRQSLFVNTAFIEYDGIIQSTMHPQCSLYHIILLLGKSEQVGPEGDHVGALYVPELLQCY